MVDSSSSRAAATRAGDVAVLAQVGQHVAQQRLDIAVRQQRRHAAQRQRLRAAAGQVEPQRASVAASRSAISASRSDTASVAGTSSGCDAQAFAVVRGLELLVADALVRGVHVDDDQALGVLGEDVDAVQLRDRVAQRRQRGVVAGRQRADGIGRATPPPIAPYSAA